VRRVLDLAIGDARAAVGPCGIECGRTAVRDGSPGLPASAILDEWDS
jgi:hypothetical protein